MPAGLCRGQFRPVRIERVHRLPDQFGPQFVLAQFRANPEFPVALGQPVTREGLREPGFAEVALLPQLLEAGLDRLRKEAALFQLQPQFPRAVLAPRQKA